VGQIGTPDGLSLKYNLAINYIGLNRHADALKLNEETLAIRKRVLPPDHPDTLSSMFNLAISYAALNRHAEAIPFLDRVVAKVDLPGLDPRMWLSALALRMQCCQKLGDLAGCRASAEMFEKRNPADMASLYDAACYRALTAALQAKVKDPDAERLAQDDADKAMSWLQKAVAAGWKNAAHMKKDTDLDALRDREDFRKVLAELEVKTEPKK
jgi:tetratricopeptide (TPR) repeat protein